LKLVSSWVALPTHVTEAVNKILDEVSERRLDLGFWDKDRIRQAGADAAFRMWMNQAIDDLGLRVLP
jgi:hypothetical protein